MNFLFLLKRTRTWLFIGLFFLLITGILFHAPHEVYAQQEGTDFGIVAFEEDTELSGTDLRIIIARIINTTLGVLGVIVVVIMLYGGFLWMTAAGNDDKIAQAKKLLGNAVIGLIIILSSWAITRFLLVRLQSAINGENPPVAEEDDDNDCIGVGCNPDVVGNPEDQCLARNGVFVVKGITPNTSVENDNNTGHKNMVIRAVFNEPVSGAIDPEDIITLARGEEIIDIADASFIDGDQVLEVRFAQNSGVCEFGNANNQQISCLPEGTYTITVSDAVRSKEGNKQLRVDTPCGEFPRTAIFRNDNDALDNNGPRIEAIEINDRTIAQAGENGIVIRRGQASQIVSTITDRQNGRGGIGYVQLDMQNVRDRDDHIRYVDAPLVRDGSHGAYTLAYDFRIGNRTNTPTKYEVTLTTADLDGNTSVATSSVIVVGENCQNGRLDPGEEDIDIGGNCVGMGRCEENWQCASQRCVNNQCVAAPIIEDISPAFDGAAGNFITITGQFFGQEQGQVFFDYAVGNDIRSVAALAPVCEGLADAWTDQAIIVEIPGNALPLNTSSSVRVVRDVDDLRENEDPYEDSTTDNRGQKPGPFNGFFVKNNTERPGLCGITDRQNNGLQGARPGTEITVQGKNLGNDRGEILFGRIPGNIDAWQNERIFSVVPNMNPEQILVFARRGEVQSNGVPLNIQASDEELTPDIIAVDPATPTPGSFVTLTGLRFGEGLGTVYVADDANAVRNCINNPNDCRVLDTQVCGDAWGNTQIVVGIPADLGPREYRILVRTQDGRQSNGEDIVTVQAGNPLPSICAIDPNRGTAPLGPNDDPLLITGKNFSDNPTVFFWRAAADVNNLNTWLSSSDHQVNGNNVLVAAADEEIETLIPEDVFDPADANNQRLESMRTGPIKVRNADGRVSNAVQYTISDCRVDIAQQQLISNDPHPLIDEGYRCCAEGPDAGVWQQNGQLCAGEERTSGYVWRFTTGIIPRIPDVVEVFECRNDNIPWSPSPWEVRNDGGDDGVCLNAVITARFTLNMDPNTLNDSTVKVFTCGNGDQAACGNYDNEVTDQFTFEEDLLNRVQLNHIQPNGQFVPNTWYRVVLSEEIRALHNTGALDIDGDPIFSTSTLRVHTNLRNLPNGAAYYFDFQTGDAEGGVNGDGLCQLIGADIDPPTFTATYLGQLQDPRFRFDPFNLQAVMNPLYYTVLGRADQACLLLDVSAENWRWQSSNNVIATVQRDNNRNNKATASANQDSEGAPTYITAAVDINGNTIQGTSTLYVTLGDPKVIQAWPVPDCQYSCTNASVGVRFNRPMMESTYKDAAGHHRLQVRECVNADCLAFTNKVINLIDGVSDRFIYQVDFANPEQLSTGTWYLASIGSDVRSIGRVNGNDMVAGDGLEPYQWRFRIKEEDPICRIARVQVHPHPFAAQLLGQKTQYGVIPVSAPDQCSSFGQRLNPWGYGWSWQVDDNDVATISEFTSQGNVPPYCTASCVYRGSTITRTDYQGSAPGLCGNRIVDLGEDCDIGIGGEVLGQSCTLACVRPGSTAPSCGDGVVQTLFGEECDQGGDKSTWVGCSASCVNTGDDVPVLCGDGDLTRGEDCDGGVGCSDRCVHEGTPLARGWCESAARGAANPELLGNACMFAQSVCGDGVIDKGEECEIVGNNVRVATANRQGVIDVNVGAEQAPRHCNAQCLLQDICALNQIPHQDNGGIRCTPGEADCRADCHILGSSVYYADPSMCTDGKVESGEYAGCELLLQANPIGENPFQVVTAIGLGNVNPETNAQEATVSAVATRVREANGAFVNINPIVRGDGDYALMCGHVEESVAAERAIDVVVDGDMEANAVNRWKDDVNDPVRVVKIQNNVFGGTRSLEFAVDKVNGGVALLQKNIPLDGAGVYRVQFAYRLSAGTLHVDIGPGRGVAGEDINIEVNTADGAWHQFDQSFFIADHLVDHLRISFDRNDPAFNNAQELVASLDEIHITKESEGLVSTTVNDCGIDDNSVGVAKNSCCAERLVRSQEYPADGSVGVCRNSVIEIAFRSEKFVDEQTIENNILLAEGFEDPNHRCIDTNVTPRVGAVLALNDIARDIEQQNIFERLWAKVKGFFVWLFGVNTAQADALHDDINTWCSGRIGVTTDVRYEWAENDAHVTSTVAVSIDTPLEQDTVYAVVLRGGVSGIKDHTGVSIRGTRKQDLRRFDDDDFFTFETGADICRLRSVTIDPIHYLFTAPITTSTFHARAESSNGSQRIQPIANVYNWIWRWGPQNHPIFAIPVPNTPTSSSDIAIGSREVEGTLTATGQALVTADQTEGDDNHVGRVFSGFTELAADFCERPWPERNAYPYEDKTFNFSMHYCADAGVSGRAEDDLPYFNVEEVFSPEDLPGGPQNAVTGTMQRLLFFNEQNDDVLGIQIFENPNRLLAKDWFAQKFQFSGAQFQSLVIDGYDAITDGNNVYINALNSVTGRDGIRRVYNNIYLLSINSDAQPNTRLVFEQLIESLLFNSNISNIGYCLAAQVDANIPLNNRRIPRDTDRRITAIAPEGLSCETDFDCRDFVGTALPNTNGVCSNAKTKFIDDWVRIAQIKSTQQKLTQYAAAEGGYPTLQGGTFLPGYTNSRWPSWEGRLGAAIGNVARDPINEWTACGRCRLPNANGAFVSCINDTQCPGENNACDMQDAQTCWDAQEAKYICPQVSRVVEYISEGADDYTLHAPLEYFDDQEPIVADFIDVDHYSDTAWCQPGELHSPFAGRCGDGVVNEGEECDPPGSAEQVACVIIDANGDRREDPNNQSTRTCTATCEWEYAQCQAVGRCGNGVIDGDELCDDGALNGQYGQCDAPGQRADDLATANKNESLGCYSTGAAGACRNGRLDFTDSNRNGSYNAGEPVAEFCDEVGGVCQFIIDDVVKIEPILYFLIDQSGSMNSVPGANRQPVAGEQSRWQVILAGMPNVAQAIEGKAKIGIAVFSGNKNPPVEILPVGFHTPAEVTAALQGAGNPGGVTPVGPAIENLRNRNVFESADPVDNARPKSLILLVDGDADRNADPTAVIRSLRVEDEIYTYVFGIGNSEDSFRQWAEAGGTDDFFRIDRPQEFRARIQNVTRCYEYALRPGDTCSLDCQSYGGYCGDSIVQAVQGEQCDDGNFVDNDGCDAACRNGDAEVNQEVAGLCGDGVVQKPNRNGVEEVCDTGENNGLRCDPEYDRSCTYCSGDCREVLMVDKIGYCGNGQIDLIGETTMGELFDNANEQVRDNVVGDYERCDTLPDGTVVASPLFDPIVILDDPNEPPAPVQLAAQLLIRALGFGGRLPVLPHQVKQCFDNNVNPFIHRGKISCSDDCRTLINDCIDCGLKNAPGPTPYLKLLNVIEDPALARADRVWGENNMLYFARRTGSGWIQRLSAFVVGNEQYSRSLTLMTDGQINGNPPQRLESYPFCTDVYSLLFNVDQIGNAVNPNSNYNSLADGNRKYVEGGDLDAFADADRLDLLSYPVDGEQISINNEILISPAVPQNHIRVVVRYTSADDDGAVAFTGNVFTEKYNDDFIRERGRRLSYLDILTDPQALLCRKVEKNVNDYWMPTNCSAFVGGTTAVHKVFSLDKTVVQATTLNLDGNRGAAFNDQPIAFFVNAISNDVNRSISQFRNRNLQVEIYEYHAGQIPEYSLYAPSYVFELNKAIGSNNAGLARYWHVFNVVRVNGQYRIYTPEQNGVAVQVDPKTSIATTHGSIETDFVDVLCNVPGQACNRDR